MVSSIISKGLNPKTYVYLLMYVFLAFLVAVIFTVGYAAMLTFTGSCEVMKEEDLNRKNEKAVFFTRNNGETNLDEIAGIGFMGVAAAFIWAVIYDLISRLANKSGFMGTVGTIFRQVAFALTAAIPVIAFANSIPALDNVEKQIAEIRGVGNTSVCTNPASKMKTLKSAELRWKSLKYGAYTFGIGLLVSVSILKFMEIYIAAVGCVPWGVYCIITILICAVCIAYAGRFYYANLECCNRIATTDKTPGAERLKKKLENAKGLDRLMKLKSPCALYKEMKKAKECPQKLDAMKASCTTNTILIVIFITLSVILVVALVMFAMAVSYLAEIAWDCL